MTKEQTSSKWKNIYSKNIQRHTKKKIELKANILFICNNCNKT